MLLKGFSFWMRELGKNNQLKKDFTDANMVFFNYVVRNKACFLLDCGGKLLSLNNQIEKPHLFLPLKSTCPTIDHIVISPPNNNSGGRPFIEFIQSTLQAEDHKVSPQPYFSMLYLINSVRNVFMIEPIVSFLFAVPDTIFDRFACNEAFCLRNVFPEIYIGIINVPVETPMESKEENTSGLSVADLESIVKSNTNENSGDDEDIDGDVHGVNYADSITHNLQMVSLLNSAFSFEADVEIKIDWDLMQFAVNQKYVKMVVEKKQKENKEVIKMPVSLEKVRKPRKDVTFRSLYNKVKLPKKGYFYPDLDVAEVFPLTVKLLQKFRSVGDIQLLIIHLFFGVNNAYSENENSLVLWFPTEYAFNTGRIIIKEILKNLFEIINQ
jgi:hypothetical protein